MPSPARTALWQPWAAQRPAKPSKCADTPASPPSKTSIFAARGFDEGVAGHISVRDPILTDHFWLNPLSTHFSLMKVSDLILVNEEGEVVEGEQPINAAAFAIHSAIHRRRPDVHAACHAHSVHGKAFSAFGRELSLYTQDSCRFYKSHGVYKQFGGVVLASEEGERIADALGMSTLYCMLAHTMESAGVQQTARLPRPTYQIVSSLSRLSVVCARMVPLGALERLLI
jgi:ribulose-5-phosphate 4-epimerase/fuculose-1-phosphate aldolase